MAKCTMFFEMNLWGDDVFSARIGGAEQSPCSLLFKAIMQKLMCAVGMGELISHSLHLRSNVPLISMTIEAVGVAGACVAKRAGVK